MPTLSSATQARSRDSSPKLPGSKPRLLDRRRQSELLGFLLCVVGLLFLLSLTSYLALDPSLNTSTNQAQPIHNWVGPAGSFTADLLLQAFGWAAYLIPLTLFIVGIRLLIVRPFEAPRTKAVGLTLLGASLTALLDLLPLTPPIGGLIRGGGLAGYILVSGLVHIFNHAGAWIVSGAVFLSSLFLVTRFSFSAAFDFLKAHLTFAIALKARLSAWRDARLAAARERSRARQLEKTRTTGKPPIVTQQASVISGQAAAPAPPGVPGIIKKAAALQPIRFLSSSSSPAPASTTPKAKTPVPPVVHALGLEDEGDNLPTPPKITGRGAHTAYKLPSASLLRPPEDQQSIDEEDLKERAARLTEKLAEFGVMGTVTQIHPGPVVTTYEFKPEAGVKYSRITNLVDDLCLAMKAESILIDRIPGKSTVGIEVPNLHREIIHLRELVESSEFAASASRLTLCLGKDITGKMKVSDLTQMPHLLIAGSTGSGKSVSINALIVSILCKSTPDEVKFIMIDPKRLELGLYDGIPHLFTPIVTEPKQAANVLRRATIEMEERLKKLAEHGVRNIEQYNKIFEPDSTLDLFDTSGEPERPLPYIVIVIDELADLMMVEPQGVEESITRLAQMARAVGIHLILATQRPSVDVITGLIKANMPSRISFRVASKVDSRTILDSNGSEALLGRGDMLFMPPGTARLLRLHGPFVTEKEIGKVVDWWKAQSKPHYNEEFLKPFRDKERELDADDDEEEDSAELDAVYDEAVQLVIESGKASTSLLQRRLRLGYGRAARLIDMMERDGIVSAPDGSKPREVLKRPEWLQEVKGSLR
ncbi:MAG TPA: DNA translocase FtsK [Terriglobia bacterium]|nr:DNA translocase FtsK [Terriglobia bacterium]